MKALKNRRCVGEGEWLSEELTSSSTGMTDDSLASRPETIVNYGSDATYDGWCDAIYGSKLRNIYDIEIPQ